jgi:hypothetical protein
MCYDLQEMREHHMNTRSESARRLTRVVVFAAAVFYLGIARAQDDVTTLDSVSLKATLENMGLELDECRSGGFVSQVREIPSVRAI